MVFYIFKNDIVIFISMKFFLGNKGKKKKK